MPPIKLRIVNPSITLFPHLASDRYWISGQANFILQGHPAFPAQYSGTNSLSPGAQTAFSRVLDLNLGYRVNQTTRNSFWILRKPAGMASARRLASQASRTSMWCETPRSARRLAFGRFMWHQIIPLSHTMVQQERNFLSLFPQLPRRRLEFRLGKYGLADFFDTNTYASDSHLQFMNWTVDNNGAYDYAADTRGYTLRGHARI